MVESKTKQLEKELLKNALELRGNMTEEEFQEYILNLITSSQRSSGKSDEARKKTIHKINTHSISAPEIEILSALKNIEQTNKRYYSMLMDSPFAFSIMKGKDLIITLANDLMKEFWGKGDDVEGKPLLEVLPELEEQPFPDMIRQVLSTGKRINADEILAILNLEGKPQKKYFNIVYQPYYEADDTITGVTTIAYDVTQMVAARKQMEAQATMVHNLLMTAPGFVCTLRGPDHVYELINEEYQKIFGKRVLYGKPLMVALPELEGQGFDKLLDKVYETGETYLGFDIPIYLARDEGMEPELRFFNFSYQAMFDENKNIDSVLVFGYEVTQQVNANKRIEESEAHFRQMADLMPAMISNADANGGLIYCNKFWLEYTGLTFEEFKDHGYHKALHPDELEEFVSRLQEATEKKIEFSMELRFKNKKGEYRWHLNIASPVKDQNGEIKMWVGSTVDIHESKETTEKIKASESRFRSLVEQAPVAICILRGKNYVIETINECMLEMWGRTMSQALNLPAFDVLPEFRNQGLKQLLDGVYKTGERYIAHELPLTIKRNGKMEDIFVKFVYEPLRESDGTISGVMALAHEITEHVVARKKIEESEKRFRLLTNSMPQKITTADTEGNVTFFNQQWMDDTGYTFEELKDWDGKKRFIQKISNGH
ncbi:MAG: PAS domain S-box protein [Bacteroidota bacterium]|nr:PAS domain S-box protein [Bacteroidota bacterium]